MHPPLLTAHRQINRAHHVNRQRLRLVVLAPIDIRPPCHAGAVEDVRWLHAAQLGEHGGAGFEACGCAVDCGVLGMLLEEREEVGGYPAAGAPDEEGWGLRGDGGLGCGYVRGGGLGCGHIEEAVFRGGHVRHRCVYGKELWGSCLEGGIGDADFIDWVFGKGSGARGVLIPSPWLESARRATS